MTIKNCPCKQLNQRWIFLECHVAYFSSNFEDEELQIHLSKDFVFIYCLHLEYLLLINMGLFSFLPIFLETLLIHGRQNLVSRTSLSIKGAHFLYEVFEHLWHVLFVANDQIDFSISNIYGQTVPTIEGSEFDLSWRHTYYVLPQHPESARKTTINDVLDIAHIKTGTTIEMNIVCITILFLRRILQFLLLEFIYFLVFLLSLFLYVKLIGLYRVFSAVQALPIGNLNVFLVFWQLYEGVKARLLLVFGVQRAVIFNTWNPKFDHILFNVDDFF